MSLLVEEGSDESGDNNEQQQMPQQQQQQEGKEDDVAINPSPENDDQTRFEATPPLWRSAKGVLRYLQGTIDYGIIYTDSSDVRLTRLTDSDWDGNVDDHISITGYAFSIGFRVITWSSKKQITVSLSSAEVEYQAMCATTCEAVWLQRLL
eukprot:PITA_26794